MYQNLLNIAQKAALEAGAIISNGLAKNYDFYKAEKEQNDFVTEIDLRAEQAIVQCIQSYFPQHGILAEESGLKNPQSEYRWFIDPLDGTTNYLHDIQHYAVSIACQYRNELVCGVVYDPARQETFSAAKGSGARLNNRRIRASSITDIAGGLYATGIPFTEKSRVQYSQFSQTMRDILNQGTRGVRRLGTASLDIAYVACGRFQGFWEHGLESWDMAAGIVIAREAGAIIYDFEGQTNYLKNGNVIVAPLGIMPQMLDLVKRNYI